MEFKTTKPEYDVEYGYDPFGAHGPTYELARLNNYLSNNPVAKVNALGCNLSTYEIWKDWFMSFFITPKQHFITVRGLDKAEYDLLSIKFPDARLFPSVWVPIRESGQKQLKT